MGKQRVAGQPTTPEKFAETTPPATTGADYTQFPLTTVMQLQGTVGGLTKAVETLAKCSDDQGKKIDHLSHVIYAAGAVVTILTAAAVFILNKLSDVLVEAFKRGLGH
jgi:hypothetical protein